jgi:hypothetical protein
VGRLYKILSGDARFSNTALNLPFSPSLSCSAVVPQALYDAASEKTTSSRLPALIRWAPLQHCLFDRYGRGSALDNDADDVPCFPGPRGFG